MSEGRNECVGRHLFTVGDMGGDLPGYGGGPGRGDVALGVDLNGRNCNPGKVDVFGEEGRGISEPWPRVVGEDVDKVGEVAGAAGRIGVGGAVRGRKERRGYDHEAQVSGEIVKSVSWGMSSR